MVGSDDIPASSSYLPPLTTVHQDFAEVGWRGVHGLLWTRFAASASRPGTVLVPIVLEQRLSIVALVPD